MLNSSYLPLHGRRTQLSRRNIFYLAAIFLITFVEVCLHVRGYRVAPLRRSLDEPFAVRCMEPDVRAPRENATIIMLARNSDRHGAAMSIESLEKQFNRWYHYPVIFLNDQPWDQSFIDALSPIVSGHVQFEVIGKDSGMWGVPEWMDPEEAKAAVAKQSWIKYGGIMSYHHMCRFNSG